MVGVGHLGIVGAQYPFVKRSIPHIPCWTKWVGKGIWVPHKVQEGFSTVITGRESVKKSVSWGNILKWKKKRP
jgi:hypothetical protein